MKLADFWNRNAKQWARTLAEKAFPSREVTNAAIVEEVLKLKPASVVDIGCGEGWLSIPLYAQNISYFGIDGSEPLVELARKNHPHGTFEKVSYADIVAGSWRPARTFQLAVFNFSLLDQQTAEILAAVKNLLTEEGHILIQTLHPNNLPENREGWHSEDFKNTNIPYEGEMPWYGMRLETWKSIFAQCGLDIEGIREPALNGKAVSIIFNLRR